MIHMQSLAGYFAGWAGGRPARRAIASTIEALAEVGLGFSEPLARGALAGQLGRSTGKRGAGAACPL